MKPAQVRELFERFKALNPNPATELEHSSPFELLIAVILSAQATDKGVNLATRKLFPVANTPQAILALGPEGLASYVRTIGLYPGKVNNILATCRILLERYAGEVPQDREALEELPGVGRKTANVVLNSAFGQPTMPVDTHIFRVANRLGLARGANVRAIEDALLKCVPAEYLLNAHHWLLLHGRYICKARVPECPRCPVVDLCEYKAKTLPLPATLPLSPAVKTKAKHAAAIVSSSKTPAATGPRAKSAARSARLTPRGRP
jgi:endonuclease-3